LIEPEDGPGTSRGAAGAAAGIGAAPILEGRSLSFRHPGAAALLFDRLSLAIAPGEFAGLIGPNGSGKTTLLRLLSGTLAPDRGEVRLCGRPAPSYRPRERARLVAVVPQESQILFNFSVLEAVLMGRAPHLGLLGLEGERDFQVARDALAVMDLTDMETRPLRDLSSGERQRVLVARALAQEPRLLLLDEATAYLDLKHRLRIGEILGDLNRRLGLTIVAVSHDLNMAARYSSRLLLLHQGRLEADGAPAQVLTPEMLRAVYETEAMVLPDPATGALCVFPRAPLGRL
jgi:cobalamin transport system ATP-binding protein